MIHPDTELHRVSPEIGLGVFATKSIKAGTIVYVVDDLDIKISHDDPLLKNKAYLKTINKFSYIDDQGTHIVSWDHAKYVNHCCNFNSISTGYGFEIAVRDIQAGEEITDEYGALNMDCEMQLNCRQPNCRGVLKPDDFDKYYKKWDGIIKNALKKVKFVPQPLSKYLDHDTKEQLNQYLNSGKGYKSIYTLKFKHFLSNGIH